MSRLSQCRNADLIWAYFGDWPDLHDSEVLALSFDRATLSAAISLYVFTLSSELDVQGRFTKRKEAIIQLRLWNIRSMSLQEFNEQNVMGDVLFRESETGREVVFDGVYGLSGSIGCEDVEVVDVRPAMPGG